MKYVVAAFELRNMVSFTRNRMGLKINVRLLVGYCMKHLLLMK